MDARDQPVIEVAVEDFDVDAGFGSSGAEQAYLGTHRASRGYVVVVLQHPGSDDSVWRDKPPGQALIDLRRAASLENFLLRAKDVPAVLDQLERWNAAAGHPLAGRGAGIPDRHSAR